LPPLADKVVVVTGASEGIGEAIAKALAIDGEANVVLASRQKEKLDKLASEIATSSHAIGSKGSAIAVSCDITQQHQVEALVFGVIERFGRVDVLVNCAGCMYYCMSKNGYTEEWKRQIDVNVLGTTLVTGLIVPHMVKQKSGHVVNITSDAGKRGFAGLGVYSGTKFYIEGFMSALRQEMVEHGVLVTNIQPGDVSTRLADRSTDSEARSIYDMSKAGHKILSADDVARSVLFVLSQPAHVAINELLIEPQAAPI